MNTTDYDVVIIGGGIHGAGCAQASAASGYRTLLLEQTGLAAATSSSSSKLVHGGLRYLESFQFGLVAESLREREYLLNNAADLVKLTPFYIPVYKTSKRKSWQIYAGLFLYALLGRFRPSTRFRRVPKKQWLSLDGLNSDNLLVVYQYLDGQTDDAELTRAVMQSAQSLGADFLCPARFINAEYSDGVYTITAICDGKKQKFTSRTLVNASGPWINNILANTRPRTELLEIELVQGSHIVLDQPSYHGVFYTEAEDGRAVFIMPWKGKTLVGTTEKIYEGNPENVMPTDEETGYLARTAAHCFPHINTTVTERFAGLRVLPRLPGDAFHRPRDTLLHTARMLPGMVSIVGGKLTGYRATAEKTLALLKPCLPERQQKNDTTRLTLTGKQD